jgi:hypothetical protein
MFRDDRILEAATSAWQTFQPNVAASAARAPANDAAPANDEVGAVWHVYREIARRNPRNAYTRHASALVVQR